MYKLLILIIKLLELRIFGFFFLLSKFTFKNYFKLRYSALCLSLRLKNRTQQSKHMNNSDDFR